MKSILVAALILSVTGIASAKDLKLDVYVASDTKFFVPYGKKITEFNVHHVDGLKKTEGQISAMLPNDPEQARARIQQFTNSGEYKAYAKSLVDGWGVINAVTSIGVMKVPAIVINDKFVAYGVTPDVAIKHYEAYIIKNGVSQ